MEKAGLDNEIARLERQRAAHFDDQQDIRRRISNARSDLEHAGERIAAIRQDIARRVSTHGDAFAMQIEGRTFTERRQAGAILLSKVRMAVRERAKGAWTIGHIGGFDLECDVRQDLTGQPCTGGLRLLRTAWQQDIDVGNDLTELGLISRLEHALDRFEDGLEEDVRRKADAEARLRGYEPRLGEPFPLQAELDGKLDRMALLVDDLKKTEGVLPKQQRAPVVKAATPTAERVAA